MPLFSLFLPSSSCIIFSGSFPTVGKHMDTRTGLREMGWSSPAQSCGGLIVFDTSFQERQKKMPCQSLSDSVKDA